jgi:hypothetical protein
MIKRINWQRWLLTALTLVGSYFIFYVLVQRPASDISIHAAWASEGSFADPTSFVHHAAHPLWHVLVALLLRIGLTLDQSAALITALCKAAQVWLLGALAAKLLAKNGWIPALCALVGGVVSAVLVPGMNPTVYLGAGSPNPWHSPTQIMALAMMLLCVPMTASIVESFQKRLPAQGAQTNVPPREAITLSALLVISLLAKPTFMQAFLPAACLYFLALWIRKPRNSAFIGRMMLVAAPAVVVMVLQYVYYFLLFSDTQGGVMLYVSWQKTGEVLGKALLLNAFPIFILFNNASRDMLRKPLYQLTLLMNAVSVVELLVLSETGHRASDGNFGWAMMGASLMLWAVTLPLFAQTVLAWVHRRRLASTGQPYLEAKPRAEAARLASGGALLLWHLASGVYYIVYLLTTTNAL